MSARILRWTPRIASIAFALFLSIFALDVFDEYQGVAAVIPLIMHLLPSLALLAVIVAAWRREIIGAVAFFGFAIWYVFSVGFDRPWEWYAFISGPAALVGLLYLANWHRKRRLSKYGQ